MSYLEDIILGYIIGLISGILPSFHINNTASFLYYLKINYNMDVFNLLLFSSSSFIIGSLLSVMFYDVPSNEDSIYIPYILRYVSKKGVRDYFLISLISMTSALIFLIILIPILKNFIKEAYRFSLKYLDVFLSIIVFLFILKYRNIKYYFIMILSSLLGFLVMYKLNINQNFALLPLFVGFYGVPHLIFSITNIKEKRKLNKKQSSQISLRLNDLIKFSFLGVMVSFMAILLPTIPPILLLSFLPLNRKYAKGYIISISSLSISDSILSIVAQKIINNSRSGVGVILGNLKEIFFFDIYLLIFVTSLYILISYLILQRVFFNEKIIKFTEHMITRILILLFILILTYFTTSIIGIVVLCLSSLVGYLTLKMKLTPIVLLFSIIVPLWLSLII